MRRFRVLVVMLGLFLTLCACGGAEEASGSAVMPENTAVLETPEPMAAPAAEATTDEPELSLPEPAEGWQETYLTFLDDNYDIITALWPGGLAGVGFIDIDLDGTPEMLLFDFGASATMGVHLFDLVNGTVCCVSSALDSASGAFGAEYLTAVSVCASYFESFRLLRNGGEYAFWVESANGTLESAWNEIIRFDCDDGVLTPVSVCSRYLECNVETGMVITESYSVGPEESDEAGYGEASAPYVYGEDMGYDGAGLFLWDNMKRYDTTYEGFMAMAQDAATAYCPLEIK